MMRRIVAALGLALSLSANAAPADSELQAYRERLDVYLAAGLDMEQAVAALQRWFGWEFALRQYGAELDVVVVRRDPRTGQINYLQTIATLPVETNKRK